MTTEEKAKVRQILLDLRTKLEEKNVSDFSFQEYNFNVRGSEKDKLIEALKTLNCIKDVVLRGQRKADFKADYDSIKCALENSLFDNL